MDSTIAKTTTIKVWDRIVRCHHWGNAALFIILYLSGSYAWSFTHEIAGYSMVLFILLRIVWGFIGTHHARFKNFLYSPRTILQYLKEHLGKNHSKQTYTGHNPAGGAMVFLLLGGLILTLFTGLATLATVDFWGPLWPLLNALSDDSARLLRHGHYYLSNGLLVLIALHLFGVVFTSLTLRENLVKAMITGHKTVTPEKTIKEISQ